MRGAFRSARRLRMGGVDREARAILRRVLFAIAWIFFQLAGLFVLQVVDMARGPASPARPLAEKRARLPTGNASIALSGYRSQPRRAGAISHVSKDLENPDSERPRSETGDFAVYFDAEKMTGSVVKGPFSGFAVLVVRFDARVDGGELVLAPRYQVKPLIVPFVVAPASVAFAIAMKLQSDVVLAGVVLSFAYFLVGLVALVRARGAAEMLVIRAASYLEDAMRANVAAGASAQEGS